VKGIFAHSLNILGAPAIMLGAPSITLKWHIFNNNPNRVGRPSKPLLTNNLSIVIIKNNDDGNDEFLASSLGR